MHIHKSGKKHYIHISMKYGVGLRKCACMRSVSQNSCYLRFQEIMLVYLSLYPSLHISIRRIYKSHIIWRSTRSWILYNCHFEILTKKGVKTRSRVFQPCLMCDGLPELMNLPLIGIFQPLRIVSNLYNCLNRLNSIHLTPD